MPEKIKVPSIENIIKAYTEGLEMRVSHEDKNEKGHYFPEEPLIEVYVNNINSSQDYSITIAHEFYHYFRPKFSEENVEKCARFIARESPEIVEFMREVFEIPEYEKIKTNPEQKNNYIHYQKMQ